VFSSDDGTTSRPSILLLNDGHGMFSRDGEGRLPAIDPNDDWTLGVIFGDFTADGAVDLYLGEAERRPRLLVNDGSGHFIDQSADDGTGVPRMPADALRSYNVDLGDVDGDGDLDIVVVNDASITTGAPIPIANQILRNQGGHFTLEALPLTDQVHDARGVACGDLNEDGIADVVIGNATLARGHRHRGPARPPGRLLRASSSPAPVRRRHLRGRGRRPRRRRT
jgi:VCBS repeat protein